MIAAAILAFSAASASFHNNGVMPAATIYNKFGCHGVNRSPELHWIAPPRGTRSFAVIAYDPDATGGWYHWIAYNLAPFLRGLSANVKLSPGQLGTTSFRERAYGGPCPPPGKYHHYVFTVYALNLAHIGTSGLTAAQLQAAMAGHILGRASVTGLYRR